MIPAWKQEKLKYISHLSKSLLKIDESVTKEKLKKWCKDDTGLSSFEHLHACTDVMLDRFIASLEALLAFAGGNEFIKERNK